MAEIWARHNDSWHRHSLAGHRLFKVARKTVNTGSPLLDRAYWLGLSVFAVVVATLVLRILFLGR